jgi:hypothetical protein
VTPSLFFQLVSWFAAFIGLVMGVLGIIALMNGGPLYGVVLFILMAVNIYAWRLFGSWSARMRG